MDLKVPEGFTLYDWQEVDVRTILENGCRALLAVQPGGSKTLLSTTAVMNTDAKTVLIIAPDSTHFDTWVPMVKRAGHDLQKVGRTTKAEKAALANLEWEVPGWYFSTPQMFTRLELSQVFIDAVIADEVHLLATPGAQGQRKLSGYERHDKPISVRSKYRLALSGTHARNKFENSWGVTRFLWPEHSGVGEVAEYPFSSWRKSRMASEFNPFAKSKKSYVDEITPGLLMKQMPCVVKHYRRDKCCEFHPNGFMPLEEPVETRRTVKLTSKQVRVVSDLHKKAMSWLDENPMIAALPLERVIRIRQTLFAEPQVEDYEGLNSKGDTVIKQRVWYEDDAKSPYADMILDILDSEGDEPVLIFTSSRVFAEFLTKRLNSKGITTREITGATKKTRDQDVKEFGTKYRVAVATIAAVGTGTDGLNNHCNTEIWVDMDTDETNNFQAKARLDRLGQKNRVQRYILTDSLGLSEERYERQSNRSRKLQESTR